MTLAWLLVQLALCALLIARAGFVLSRSADRLAALYGWGRGWVGLALLASVTSLPELASTLNQLRTSSDSTNTKVLVTIYANELALYERVIDVLDALTRAKISNVTFQAGAPE